MFIGATNTRDVPSLLQPIAKPHMARLRSWAHQFGTKGHPVSRAVQMGLQMDHKGQAHLAAATLYLQSI